MVDHISFENIYVVFTTFGNGTHPAAHIATTDRALAESIINTQRVIILRAHGYRVDGDAEEAWKKFLVEHNFKQDVRVYELPLYRRMVTYG